MKFLQRLRFYLVGLGIGLFFVFIFLNQKSCGGWLPNQRVLTAINSYTIYISEQKECELDCLGYSKLDVFRVLTEGKVNFSESEVKTDDKMYRIELEKFRFDVVLNSKDSIVKLVSFGESHCANCEGLDAKYDKIYNVSEQMIFADFNEKPVYFNEQSNCALACFNMSKDTFLDNIVKKGKVDFHQSKPSSKPYPIYKIYLDSIPVSIEVGKDQVRVLNVQSGCDCLED